MEPPFHGLRAVVLPVLPGPDVFCFWSGLSLITVVTSLPYMSTGSPMGLVFALFFLIARALVWSYDHVLSGLSLLLAQYWPICF